MRYEERKEVVTHATPQQVTLVLCTRCGARPDGLDETRSPFTEHLASWNAPHIHMEIREPADRTRAANADALDRPSHVHLCPACTSAFHDFMSAIKGEEK